MKKAYVFPGQGSQFPGMAKDLYENNPKAKEMLERANEVLGFRITDIMFEGTPEDLKATKVTQPAVFLHSVVLAACYENFTPDMVAGHSLGEFSALAAAGAIEFEDALKLVAVRASAMQKCCEAVPGTMAAIIGLPNETVEQICADVDGLVVAANYNSDGQVVISGAKEAVEAACVKAKEAGAKRALPLAVSGAFHSPLMEPARVELAQAIEQTDAGADILDVNVGLPSIDEKAMMIRAIKELQGVVDAPLQIDSTMPEVLEAALRIYNGKPIVNSVNGEEKSLSTVLPLVKRYGAAVVGLTLDENGIPETAQQRFDLAKLILEKARSLGIPEKDVFIDCLTLTASTGETGPGQTLKAVRRVREELGLQTVLGVSNISFGLPNRPLINRSFLAMALQNGLPPHPPWATAPPTSPLKEQSSVVCARMPQGSHKRLLKICPPLKWWIKYLSLPLIKWARTTKKARSFSPSSYKLPPPHKAPLVS